MQNQQYGQSPPPPPPHQMSGGHSPQPPMQSPPPPGQYQSQTNQFQGQQEQYVGSVLGGSVPKMELHNPEGIIQCGDLKITVEGQLVPVIDVLMGGQLGIFFEHHILLWKDPNVGISMRLSGGFRRFFAGIPIFQTESQGPGNISFSRDSVGQVVFVKLQPGQRVEVREHQFILATQNVDYGVTTFQGMSNILFSRAGLLIDVFTCMGPQEGLVVLHGYGNVFERQLRPGEALDVEPGAWLWKDPSVTMQTVNIAQSSGGGGFGGGGFGGGGGKGGGFLGKLGNVIGTAVSGGGSLFMNRLIGPGRIGLQSMTYHPPQAEGAPAAGGQQNLNLGNIF